MSQRIALVGHCGPDSSYLRLAAGSAARGVSVVSADEEAELQAVLEKGVDLLLLNRVLDYGFAESEGVALVRRLKGKYPELKMIVVSNYPETQAAAVAAGALPGFGKREVGTPRVAAILREALAGVPTDQPTATVRAEEV